MSNFFKEFPTQRFFFKFSLWFSVCTSPQVTLCMFACVSLCVCVWSKGQLVERYSISSKWRRYGSNSGYNLLSHPQPSPEWFLKKVYRCVKTRSTWFAWTLSHTVTLKSWMCIAHVCAQVLTYVWVRVDVGARDQAWFHLPCLLRLSF